MPAWGPSDTYRESAGFPREYGAWTAQQFREWLHRMGQYGMDADRLRDFLTQYNLGQFDQGYVSPEEIRARGEQIMPGMEEMLARRMGRLGDIGAAFGQRVSTGDTMAGITENLLREAEDLVRTGQITQDELDALFARATGRQSGVSQDVIANIRDAMSRMQGGVNETIGGLRGRSGRLAGDLTRALTRTYGDLVRSSDQAYGGAMGQSSGVTRRLLNDYLRTVGELEGDQARTYGGLLGSQALTMADLTGRTARTYDDLIGRLPHARLRGEAGAAYRDLEAGSGAAFDEARRTLAELRPGGEAQAARVARSFAPAIAGLKSRLRRGGIGPTDLQYISAMADLDASRARAVDDASAGAIEGYIDRAVRLGLDQQAARERLRLGDLSAALELGLGEQASRENLGRGRLQTDIALGLEGQAGRERLDLQRLSDAQRLALAREATRQGLTLDDLVRQVNLSLDRQRSRERLSEAEYAQGRDIAERELGNEIALGLGQMDRNLGLEQEGNALYRQELLRNLGAMQNLDVGRTNASLENLDTMFNRTQQWRRANDQAALMRRALEMEDWQTAANLARELNQEELTAQDIRDAVYNRGQDWVIRNLGVREGAASNLAQIMARLEANQMNAANTAMNFGNQARGAYNQAAEQSAGRGGWATRLVGALAPIAASFIPGVGPAISAGLSGAFGAIQGQAGRGQQGGGAGAMGGGGGSPYGFNWQNVYNTWLNNQATQRGMARGQQSPAQVAPGQIPGWPVTTPAWNPSRPWPYWYGGI